MDELLIVVCTFPDLETGRQIGTTVVERQLAACVNLLPGMESIYRWQGQVECAAEVIGVFKTTRTAYPKLAGALAELHPYEVPEIVACQPAAVAATYLTWVAESVVKSSCGEKGL